MNFLPSMNLGHINKNAEKSGLGTRFGLLCLDVFHVGIPKKQ